VRLNLSNSVEYNFFVLFLSSQHSGDRRRRVVVRDLCPIYDLPAQVLVHDQQRNPGVHHTAKHGVGIYIPESHHVRRYRQRADVGKHHGDGVAGRQDVHRGHNANVGI